MHLGVLTKGTAVPGVLPAKCEAPNQQRLPARRSYVRCVAQDCQPDVVGGYWHVVYKIRLKRRGRRLSELLDYLRMLPRRADIADCKDVRNVQE
jgi:hypothetical protein